MRIWKDIYLDGRYLLKPVATKLSAVGASVLNALIDADGKCVSHDDIRAAVLAASPNCDARDMETVIIFKLRKWLGLARIKNVRGAGFAILPLDASPLSTLEKYLIDQFGATAPHARAAAAEIMKIIMGIGFTIPNEEAKRDART